MLFPTNYNILPFTDCLSMLTLNIFVLWVYLFLHLCPVVCYRMFQSNCKLSVSVLIVFHLFEFGSKTLAVVLGKSYLQSIVK